MRNYFLTAKGKTNQTWSLPLKYVTTFDAWSKQNGFKSRSAAGIWLLEQIRFGKLVLDQKRLSSTEHHDGTRRNNFSLYSTPKYFDALYDYCDAIGTTPSRLVNEGVRTFVLNKFKLNGKQNATSSTPMHTVHGATASIPHKLYTDTSLEQNPVVLRKDLLELARTIVAQNNAILAALLPRAAVK